MEKIEIIVNGEPNEVPTVWVISDLISQLDLEGKQVAVEVNEEIVSRNQWSTQCFNVGDNVEIVHFVGGGERECNVRLFNTWIEKI
jgi:thiamine biosynthesis protein ThiS